MKNLSLSIVLFLFFLSSFSVLADDQPLELWYNKPATEWTEALPIGNGSLGAMIFGGVDEERLQLNEDTIWGGGPYNSVNPEAKSYLPRAKALINAGRYKDAEAVLSGHVMAKPINQMPYQTVGNLRLIFPSSDFVSDYRRDLALDTATASVTYLSNGVRHRRDVFASHPDHVIVMHLTADQPGSISFSAAMDTEMQASVTTEGNDVLLMHGCGSDVSDIKGAIRYTARIKILSKGGKTFSKKEQVCVVGADEVTLLIAVATNYRNFSDLSGDPDTITQSYIQAAVQKEYNALYATHVSDFQELFHRVTIDLGKSKSIELPTDVRIKHFSDGDDPQLAALYYQFGRYLLISSSRKGSQPANLQGIWNESTNPPWQSKYTININTEMNYWIAESGNLSECVEPLIKMVEDLSLTGAVTAKEMYGARGWVAHHNTDLWRATAPIDGPFWGMWPTGGAWLCKHLWDRYEFSQDPDVLRKVYPLLKGSCEFFLDTLQVDPKNGWLVTNPSISPENAHPMGTSLCAGPTMDMQILRDLFQETVQASEILGVDISLRNQLISAKSKLAPNQIGGSGQLQEWMEDWDMQAPDLHHRHVSHLYGLFPGNDFSVQKNPDLAAAAKKSLQIRGDEATGWATAWRICLWAHLRDGDHAYHILKFLLSPERTYPDMFDAHPPFQIDGNFGGASGIVEMLMQSSDDSIVLLPALPNELSTGKLHGVKARGNFLVDLDWQNRSLTHAKITALKGGSTTIFYNGEARSVSLQEGETYWW